MRTIYLLTAMTEIRNTISHINSSTGIGFPLIGITLGSDDPWTAEMEIKCL